MPKVCFVISPFGTSASKVRADYVVNTYIKPVCTRLGYEPLEPGSDLGQDIISGTNTALENAPMAVAYMACEPVREGGGGWNANVMIAIGYRLASRLPLILLCDQKPDGGRPDLPLNVSMLNVIDLPRPDPRTLNWQDPEPDETVNRLRKQFLDEERAGRILNSKFPVAAINADSAQATLPSSLYYTAASLDANNVFGIEPEAGHGPRLVGRTLEQFYAGLQKRMHPAQYRAFMRDQKRAINKLQRWAMREDKKQSAAMVPIVFEHHEDEAYNHRAYLPIVVEDFLPPHDRRLSWYNLRVLYLNVTTVTKKLKGEDGDEYYACSLDPTSSEQLDPLEPFDPIRIFLSYRSGNRENVKKIYELLRAMKPYTSPFMDFDMNPGVNWAALLTESLKNAEICFLFLDDQPAPGQQSEMDIIQARIFSADGRVYPVVPVDLRLRGRPLDLPFPWQQVKFDDLNSRKLCEILWRHFPERCPEDWRPEKSEIIDLSPSRAKGGAPAIASQGGRRTEGGAGVSHRKEYTDRGEP